MISTHAKYVITVRDITLTNSTVHTEMTTLVILDILKNVKILIMRTMMIYKIFKFQMITGYSTLYFKDGKTYRWLKTGNIPIRFRKILSERL